MHRVGIVGFGGMGRGRLRYYADMPDAQVVAIADVRADALRSAPDVSALLASDVDTVSWFPDVQSLAESQRIDVGKNGDGVLL